MENMINAINNHLNNLKITGYAENSLKAYEIHLRYYFSYIKQFNLDYLNIKGPDMIQFRKYMTKYMPATINGRLSAIRGFYDYLIDIGETENNPVRSNLFIRSHRVKPRPLTVENQTILKNFLGQKFTHINLAFYLMLETGIRLAELLVLKKEHFITINDVVYLEILVSKGFKSRIVPIFNQDLLRRLNDYFDTIFDGNVFPLTPRAYQYHALEFQKLTGIEFNIHTCRHTFATNKAREGVPVAIIQKLLGHKNIQTTMYYIDIADDVILNIKGDEHGNYKEF